MRNEPHSQAILTKHLNGHGNQFVSKVVFCIADSTLFFRKLLVEAILFCLQCQGSREFMCDAMTQAEMCEAFFPTCTGEYTSSFRRGGDYCLFHAKPFYTRHAVLLQGSPRCQSVWTCCLKAVLLHTLHHKGARGKRSHQGFYKLQTLTKQLYTYC